MGYQLPTRSKVEFISLKISNLNQMVDFYTKVIGLSLIKRTESEAYLGIRSRKKIFISLHKLNNPSKDKNVANMRSFALVLPDQDSFKKSLVHIDNLGIKVSGVEMNDYFDRFSLTDPEGNRVFLYVKKISPSKTDLAKVNRLEIPFRSVSLNKYLGDFKVKSEKLPTTTKLGWIDMAVSDLKKSIRFYHRQLGLAVKLNSKGNKAVLMTNDGHEWQFILTQNSNLETRSDRALGLDYFVVKMFRASEIRQLADYFKKLGLDFDYSAPNNLIFVSDPDQINIIFSLL